MPSGVEIYERHKEALVHPGRHPLAITVCFLTAFNNFNTTTHPVFTTFYVDKYCEVDFTASAQETSVL
jgi:hypothetical protein